MTEQAEPRTAAGMLKAIEKSSDGTNVLRETIQTMKMSDGKTVKGDVLLPIANIKGVALTELRKLVEAAKASGKKGSAKWEFRTSPHAQFGKSLDDTLIAFLAWARVGSDDEPDTPGENEGGDGQMTNVSKAFRRLEAYADWMESTGDDLVEPPLSGASVVEPLKVWTIQASYDATDRLVWWIDLGKLDNDAFKTLPAEQSLRALTWFMHAVMYDAKAQQNGCVIVENLAQLSFWKGMTLVPMKLSVKLDRLTIGVAPVKMKLFLCLDTPAWMSALMRLFGTFMSKKMMKRMVLLKKDWGRAAEVCGGVEFVPTGYGECGGTLTADPVLDPLFGRVSR